METEQRTRRRTRRREWATVELIFFGIAVLLALIMTFSGLFTLAGMIGGGKEKKDSTTDKPDTSAVSEGEPSEETPVETVTPSVSDDLAQYAAADGYPGQIYAQLADHPEAAYILRNLSAYPEYMLKFAARFPESMGFVAAYPDMQGINIRQPIDLTAEGSSETVPLLIQWDSRWGYAIYGEGVIGTSGCGPTCLSMVSIFLNGWTGSNDPMSIANYANQNGYYVAGSGSSWSLMEEGCASFGLSSKELPLVEGKIADALAAGKPVIISLGEGYFTDNGHYIVITGYNDGAFSINDPNSPVNSARTWTFDELKDQIRNIWAFEKA